MRISDWSADVCSSDLGTARHDAVAWGYARAANALGVDIIENCEVTGFIKQDGQVSGVERSEEHTSELQSLMRISYAVFCLKKKKNQRLHVINNRKSYTEHRKNIKRTSLN